MWDIEIINIDTFIVFMGYSGKPTISILKKTQIIWKILNTKTICCWQYN
jgi:hypothetical protein